MAEAAARDVLRRHEAELRRLPDVSAVGLSTEEDGREVIVVFVRQGIEDLDVVRDLVPAELEGYRTEIRPEIRVLPGHQEEGEANNSD
jgi:hypothetical protein